MSITHSKPAVKCDFNDKPLLTKKRLYVSSFKLPGINDEARTFYWVVGEGGAKSSKKIPLNIILFTNRLYDSILLTASFLGAFRAK